MEKLMMFLLTQVYSITLKAAFPVWEGNMMPVQLHLLFLHSCFFFLCSSCWKLVPACPSSLCSSCIFSSYQTCHIIPPSPFNVFISYCLLFRCIKLKLLGCISYCFLFLFSYSVAFPPFCPWWQPRWPVLPISYQMLPRSTSLSLVLCGDIKNFTSKWKSLLEK